MTETTHAKWCRAIANAIAVAGATVCVLLVLIISPFVILYARWFNPKLYEYLVKK